MVCAQRTPGVVVIFRLVPVYAGCENQWERLDSEWNAASGTALNTCAPVVLIHSMMWRSAGPGLTADWFRMHATGFLCHMYGHR